jgi:hypothetical protein
MPRASVPDARERPGRAAARPLQAGAALTFVSTTGGGDLAWENERYHSGPLPHTRYLLGGAPENVFRCVAVVL